MGETCFYCKKPVTLNGRMDEIDGFHENVAPNAASGGSMFPVHWACSSFPRGLFSLKTAVIE